MTKNVSQYLRLHTSRYQQRGLWRRFLTAMDCRPHPPLALAWLAMHRSRMRMEPFAGWDRDKAVALEPQQLSSAVYA